MIIEKPISPGRVLEKQFLQPFDIGNSDLALKTGLSKKHISELRNGHVRFTAETALLVSKALGTSPDFWLNLQMQMDVWEGQQKLNERLEKIEPIVLVA